MFASQIFGKSWNGNQAKAGTYSSGCTIEICINNLEKEEAEVGVRTTQGMNSHNSCVPWADILEISLKTS